MSKRALLVGINNDRNPDFNLNGCLNDVESLHNLLITNYNFRDKNITSLLNEEATSENIKKSLLDLLIGVKRGDILIFGFCGHGTMKDVKVGDETTQRNQALVPFECRYDSLIVDDWLFETITQYVFDPSISFTGIYDCCHSGTMVRAVQIDSETGDLEAVSNRCIDVESLRGIKTRDVEIGPYNTFSACKDEELAADLKINGVPRGAFSYSLHSALSKSPTISTTHLEKEVLSILQSVSKFPQNPCYYSVNENLPVFSPVE